MADADPQSPPQPRSLGPPWAVDVEGLTMAYGEQPVLWDVDLKVPAGVMLAIIGPNGAGKTTLLKAIMGLLKPAAGRVRIFEQPLRVQRRLISYMPQRGTVDWDFPTTVSDVVMMGRYGALGWLKWPGKRDRELAQDALRQVDMHPLAERHISELSGGQQQRVFLARALVQDAEIFLMDEPFAGVDAASERAIITVMRTLRERGKTLAVVHHDLQTVPEYFDWAALLNVRRIACGPVETAFTEAHLRAAFGDKLAVAQREGSQIFWPPRPEPGPEPGPPAAETVGDDPREAAP